MMSSDRARAGSSELADREVGGKERRVRSESLAEVAESRSGASGSLANSREMV